MDLRQFNKYEFSTETRSVNVQDEFMNLTAEQVRDATVEGRSRMVTVCMNLTSDFNKASAIRSHSAFLGAEVFMIGKRKFDRRGTVGSHHYNHIYQAESLVEVIDALHEDGYTVVAVDNNSDFECFPVYGVDLPEKTAFVYGEESSGLTDSDLELCDLIAYIPQWGAAPRSLNVAAAASIMMSEYARRWRAW